MSDAIIKFTRGIDALDLHAGAGGTYSVDDTFQPPRLGLRPIVAADVLIDLDDREPRPYNFNLSIEGDSEAECHHAYKRLQNFLMGTARSATPTYFEYRNESTFPFEPLWGQRGANLRFPVLFGELGPPVGFAESEARTKLLSEIGCNLTIANYAETLRQRAGSATGGIYQTRKGNVAIPPARTNKFTNPVFGAATFSTGWTATGNLTYEQVTDEDFVRYGVNAVKLTARDGACQWTQSLNAGNTNTHVLSIAVRLLSGGAVSATQCRVYYNGSVQTTTFIPDPERDGWYIAYAAFAGVASAVTAGVQIEDGYAVVAGGMQLEDASTRSPIFTGDMLGCAWSGTAHASTSTRTAARLRVAAGNIFNLAAGCLRFIWRTGHTGTPDRFLFALDSTSVMSLVFEGGDTFTLNYGASGFSSAAQTADSTTAFIVHVVWENSTLSLYVNGQPVAGNPSAIYVPPSGHSYLYIGTDASAANHAGGEFIGCTAFDQAPTAAQVLADYTNLLPLLSEGQAIDPPLWWWTADGDDVLDNVLDTSGSTGAPHTNYGVMGGVQGDMPARTEWVGNLSVAWSQISKIGLSLLDTDPDVFVKPDRFLYQDLSGSADVNSSGGEYESQTVGTTGSEAIYDGLTVSRRDVYEALRGRELYLVAKLDDAGGNLQCAARQVMGNQTIVTKYKNINANLPNYVMRAIGPFTLIEIPDAGAPSIAVNFISVRSSGSAALIADFYAIASRPFIVIGEDAPLETTNTGFLIDGGNAFAIDTSDIVSEVYPNIGDAPFDVRGSRLNLIMLFVGMADDSATLIRTLTFSRIFVTPRWSLM